VDNTTLEADIKQHENADVSRPTIIDYLDALSRLMIFEEQLAFSANIRSTVPLRKSPKRHFCDVSLAIAALKLNKESLLKDLRYCGFLFESLVYHDLKIYARASDAEVFHYRDAYDLEIDSIVRQSNGNIAAFEVKLGIGQIDDAAANLLKFASLMRTPPKSLNVITGTGFSHRRNDGINVISLSSLGR
jgi:predicted AAA+ superfamily ATPase